MFCPFSAKLEAGWPFAVEQALGINLRLMRGDEDRVDP
jgi:hypothetical protein